MKSVSIYTDGSCKGNPGPGGWSAILRCDGHSKQISGHVDQTTNNQMELAAVLYGLQALKTACEVIIFTDSNNVIGWLSKGYKRKNAEINALCSLIDDEMAKHQVSFKKVEAHADNVLNNEADRLASAAALA